MYYCSNPRPVEVVTFNASLVSPVVNLDWTTSSEVNSDYFEIERSVDGNPFTTIGRVDAAGYSVHSINYQLVDAKAVGVSLFGPYLLVVELASLLLLGALVAAYHLGKHED